MRRNFNWTDFLNSHRVNYVTSGKNVAIGEINIKCPFCGINDPSNHMALSLKPGKPYWQCWRDSGHKGKSPYKLIKALLGCSHDQVLEILGKDIIDAGEFQEILKDPVKFLNGESKVTPYSDTLHLPDGAKPVRNFGSTRIFWNYLKNVRKINQDDIDGIVRRYGISCCTDGYWRSRILVPVKLNKELVTWTGRTISSDPYSVRYLSLTTNPEFEKKHGYRAKVSIKDTVFNYDKVSRTGGDVLFLVEGPLDAINMDYYAKGFGCRAVGLYNMTTTPTQKMLLQTIRPNFERVVILLDDNEDAAAYTLQSELSFLSGIEVGDFLGTYGASDPAELSPAAIEDICSTL